MLLSASVIGAAQAPAAGAARRAATVDELFDTVAFTDVQLSPDGSAVVVATHRPDWARDRYRQDLWLHRVGSGTVTPLSLSGRASTPRWSPDGRWISFLADEAVADDDDERTMRLFVIAADGGESIPITEASEDVHAAVWAADSKSLFFAAEEPWADEQAADDEEEWKDVIRFRESERGDTILRVAVDDALRRHASAQATAVDDIADMAGVVIATTSWRVRELAASPDGVRLAFATGSVSERVETMRAYEIYTLDLTARRQAARPLTSNAAIEEDLTWSADGRSIFFTVDMGSVEGPYQDWQQRLYTADAASGRTTRVAGDFPGAVVDYALSADGPVLIQGIRGTEAGLYVQAGAAATFAPIVGWPGSYDSVSLAARGRRIAFVHSAFGRPPEVYLADDYRALDAARRVTAFNQELTERALPEGRVFNWKADDGTPVEGLLIYPPGRMGQKNLRLLTLIHGGPADADMNRFGPDWYEWSSMAAASGWLVFRPNYRGSTGYGDTFLQAIVPQIVSRPGKDILAGVDALVAEGFADPTQLAIGGYSYGGYLTNWLITQTTRFKAAVSGAGAVEHAANWGNDDLTLDDAWFLGGTPWQVPQRYHDEAALWQIDKVRTPTHLVSGSEDVRVSVLESYLLERALHTLGVPTTLLLFPGEGHELANDPWHGRIKVREELRWLEKYVKAGPEPR